MDAPTNPGLEQQPVRPAPLTKLRLILGMLGIAMGLFLAWVRAWLWSYGDINAEMLGYAAGGAILPALVAYLIAGRKRVRNFSRFGLWFAGMSLVIFIVTPRPVSPQQHMVDLMMEAAGTKPVDNSRASSTDQTVRDMMRGILSERKAFDQEMGQFTPELAKVYTAQSFSSKQAMQSSLEAVRGAAAADQRYAQQLESLPERIRATLKGSGLSEHEAAEFAKGVNSAFGDSKVLNIRRQVTTAENQWADATVSLYDFSITNASGIRVQGPQLVIRNEKIRTGWNARLNSALVLRDSLNTLNHQLEGEQQKYLQGVGLTPANLGLENPGKP